MFKIIKQQTIPAELEQVRSRIDRCRLQLLETTYTSDSAWQQDNTITLHAEVPFTLMKNSGRPAVQLKLVPVQERTELQASFSLHKSVRVLSAFLNGFIAVFEVFLLLTGLDILHTRADTSSFWVLLIPPAFLLCKQLLLWALLSLNARHLWRSLLQTVFPAFSS